MSVVSAERSVPFVVVGGGPAAAAATRVLAAAGQDVVVVSAEASAPYDRTALSKPSLLSKDAGAPSLWRDDEAWRSHVDLRLATRVVALDLQSRTIRTEPGDVIAFGRLLLCTGAEPRRLPLPGADGPGVHYLRDVTDAAALRADLAVAERVAVIGGGVIGLEVAAAAAILGRHVEVIEAAPRVLGRGIPEPVADWLVRLHTTHGVVIRAGIGPAEIVRTDEGVTAVRLTDGTDIPADVVVIGVGVLPRDSIAADAGIEVDDGILVEPSGQTSCPDVFAAGDVTRSRVAGGPAGGRGVRLESYQPAGQQGEAAALTMLGTQSAFLAVPWSWSDQYDAVLQACGIASPGAEQLVCGTDDAVLVLSFSGDRLVAACGVASGTAIAKPVRTAQLVIAAGRTVDRAAVEAVRGDLAQLTKTLRTAARTAAV